MKWKWVSFHQKYSDIKTPAPVWNVQCSTKRSPHPPTIRISVNCALTNSSGSNFLGKDWKSCLKLNGCNVEGDVVCLAFYFWRLYLGFKIKVVFICEDYHDEQCVKITFVGHRAYFLQWKNPSWSNFRVGLQKNVIAAALCKPNLPNHSYLPAS